MERTEPLKQGVLYQLLPIVKELWLIFYISNDILYLLQVEGLHTGLECGDCKYNTIVFSEEDEKRISMAQFVLSFYQPVVHMFDEKIYGYELRIIAWINWLIY